MKKRCTRRFVRSAKWAGLALVLAILGTEIASVGLSADFFLGHYGILLKPGHVLIMRGTYPIPSTALFVHRHAVELPAFRWFFYFQREVAPPAWVLEIPLWFVALVAAIPTALLWWADLHRFPPDHCSECGYDLSAPSATSTCPECGKPKNESIQVSKESPQ